MKSSTPFVVWSGVKLGEIVYLVEAELVLVVVDGSVVVVDGSVVVVDGSVVVVDGSVDGSVEGSVDGSVDGSVVDLLNIGLDSIVQHWIRFKPFSTSPLNCFH